MGGFFECPLSSAQLRKELYKKMKKKSLRGQIILMAIFTVFCALVLFPFLLVLSVSFSSEADIANYGYSILPKSLDFSAYKYVLQNPAAIIDAYKITIFESLLGTTLSVLLMAMSAYALSVKALKGRSLISMFFYFTMLFSGGLVPSYILITQYLHLNDTIWVYIFPSLISPWHIFMMRTFFTQIPGEISESAMMDGASEYRIFLQMVIPLSKPVIATVYLLGFLGRWNQWNTSMLYIDNQKLISLQYLLQRMMKNIDALQQAQHTTGFLYSVADIPSESSRMAMAVVVAGPALLVFPFFQKYFVKGLTVGSVKG